MLRFFNQADHRDRGRWIDRTTGILIVKADVPAGHRRIESAASFGEAANGFSQLPKNFRLKRIAKIQIVGGAERSSAGTGEVSRSFRNGNLAAFIWIEVDVSRVAINGESDEFV